MKRGQKRLRGVEKLAEAGHLDVGRESRPLEEKV